MEKEQGKLIIIVSVVFAMVLLCMICTSGSVPEVKSLQACTPEAVSVLDDGRELYDFILDQNDDKTNSIVFYSAHQEIAVYADGKLIYRLDAVPGIWGNTPGWTWNIVRFSSNVSSLQVQFTPCYPEAAAGLTGPYCIWVFFPSCWEYGRPMRRMWQRCSWPTGRDALIWHLLRSCCCRCPLSCL